MFQNMEEKHALRVVLENAVEELWKKFKEALDNYNETTNDRRNAFENLKAKDEKSAKEIEMQMRKLQRITVRFYRITVRFYWIFLKFLYRVLECFLNELN